DFRGLLNRQVSRLRSLEDFPAVSASGTIGVRDVAAITHQTARHDILALRVNCWDCMARGQGHYPFTLAEEEPVTLEQYSTRTLLGDVRKGRIQLAPNAGPDNSNFRPSVSAAACKSRVTDSVIGLFGLTRKAN